MQVRVKHITSDIKLVFIQGVMHLSEPERGVFDHE